MKRSRQTRRRLDHEALLPDILRLQADGCNATQVGRALGISNTTAAEIAERAGSPFVKAKPGPQRRKHDHDALRPDVLRLQALNYTGSEVGQLLGIPQSVAAEIARKAGSPFSPSVYQTRPAAAKVRTYVHQRPDLADLYAAIRHATHTLDFERLPALIRQAQTAWGPDYQLTSSSPDDL